MTNAEIFTLISIGTTVIVGIILRQQIRSQKQIIDKYKGFVEATDPDKIITLHKREVEKIEQGMKADINELKTQVIELAQYVNYILDDYARMAKNIGQPELFTDNDRAALINRNMPHCAGVLDKIHSLTSSSSKA
jgi:hypothetical protein